MVAIGTSAGGVDALITIVRQLPPDFPAPICIVLHIPPDSPSLLAHILQREGALPAKEAEDGESYRNGTIYVAPPDRHLLVVKDGKLRTVRGPRENRHRPAIDPLFRSAAAALGPAVIGVILTGALDDGTAGLVAVKKQGGTAIIQDPRDALYPAMPSSAMDHVAADHVLPLADIARQLTLTANEPFHGNGRGPAGTLIAMPLGMLKRNQHSNNRGAVDGGEGRGIPLGGHDEQPPIGYQADDEDEPDLDLGFDEDDDGQERRRDPLRKI